MPVTFNGGAAGYDTLALQGGQFQTSRYGPTGPDAGTITLDSQVVHYSGLEPVTDTAQKAFARLVRDVGSVGSTKPKS